MGFPPFSPFSDIDEISESNLRLSPSSFVMPALDSKKWLKQMSQLFGVFFIYLFL